VVLDSTAPKSGAAVAIGSAPDSVLRRVTVLFSTVAHFGVGRLIAKSSYGSLPPHSRGEARANASTAPHLASFIEEFAEANGAMPQASAPTSLHGKPLI